MGSGDVYKRQPIQGALELLEIASVAGFDEKESLIEMLCTHISICFEYFSKLPVFVGISYGSLLQIAEFICKKKSNNHSSSRDNSLNNVLLEAILRWIYHSRVNRRKHLAKLLENVELTRLSEKNLKCVLKNYDSLIDVTSLQECHHQCADDENQAWLPSRGYENPLSVPKLKLLVGYVDENITDVFFMSQGGSWSFFFVDCCNLALKL